MHAINATPSLSFLHSFHDFWGPAASRRPPGLIYGVGTEKVQNVSLLSLIFGILGTNRNCLKLLFVNFYACFGIPFGKPPAPSSKDSGVILGSVFKSFSHFAGDAAKLPFSQIVRFFTTKRN